MRIGIVCTVYNEEQQLDHWCQHHFGMGFAHAFIVFDKYHLPKEQQTAARLREQWPSHQLTILHDLDDEQLPHREETQTLKEFSLMGSTPSAICARQCLNASVVLQQIQQQQLTQLDWILHIDADERFYSPKDTLASHFEKLHKNQIRLVRYINHELLLPSDPQKIIFKISPKLSPESIPKERSYFCGYSNGKSAVAVAEADRAAGVHSWYLKDPNAKGIMIKRPAILHLHNSNEEKFKEKYLYEDPEPQKRLFPPLPLFKKARQLQQKAQAESWTQTQLEENLRQLYRSEMLFSEAEIKDLDQRGRLLYVQVK